MCARDAVGSVYMQRGQWWIQRHVPNGGQGPTPQLLQAEVLLAANKRQTASSSFWPLIVPWKPVLDIRL